LEAGDWDYGHFLSEYLPNYLTMTAEFMEEMSRQEAKQLQLQQQPQSS